ncbi:MAG: hypothetical protein HPY66_1543 [Firmicutes bacterium]|nr:hypothetical protein [Bacillota bacterium]MDI6706406.1 F0F1 ATP synthase subunit B [Bacillota bacterium]
MRAELVGIDINMVFQLLNTLLLFVLLRKLLFRRVSDFMRERRKKIEGALREAEEKNRQADQLKQTYAERVRDIEREAERAFRDAAERAEKRKAEILKEAREEAEAIIRRARKEIELEREKAISEAKEYIVGAAIGSASKLIRQNLDSSENRRMVREFIDEVGRVS